MTENEITEEGDLIITFRIRMDKEDQAMRNFTEGEKALLKPIAETIAMMDGNAFFTINGEEDETWYEQYLPEAYALFKSNGGFNGWASEASWMRGKNLTNPAVMEAWENFVIVNKLSKESK